MTSAFVIELDINFESILYSSFNVANLCPFVNVLIATLAPKSRAHHLDI